MTRIDRLLPLPAAEVSDEDLLEAFGATPERWLRVNFVSSVDGAATAGGLSGGLSGAADKRVFELLRRLSDVVLVGAGTVRAEGYGPMLVSTESADWRTERGRPAHPVFAIVTGALDLDPASRIFTAAPVRPIVVTTERPTAERRARFESVADVVVAGERTVDVVAMVSELADRGLGRVLNEGGPSLFGALLAADRVDELCLTVSPLLVAGDSGRIARGPLEAARDLSLAQVLHSEGALLLRYLRGH
ncbi:pyrimidine reductase family protein [Lacisediminihabitans sp.]|uniref:pyrimidine reductase family protein n=1 Tax=Lacisediminihabitans sp. TaxID=2787631 RepID=UPI00374D7D53